MKIVIGYPPLSSKGVPLLSQNRQFQWFSNPTYVYPVIPAYAATLLQAEGYEIKWLDGIAEDWSYQEWLQKICAYQPDLLLLETKTPVIQRHWSIIDQLKTKLPQMKIALAGDHATALPEESLEKSLVDYVLTGGNFDFLTLNLAQHLKNQVKLEKGVWYRKEGKVINTGKFSLKDDLNQLPMIDRELTKWRLYAYKNGNFKYRPGAYTMAGRDCWWRRNGGCTFCSWTTLFPQFSVRSVESVLDEIGKLIELGAREAFDDTGTFMAGEWLKSFCKGMIERGYHKKIVLGCNMRYGVLQKEDYELMAKANFRFILYGLESINQKTIEKLNKGTEPAKIKPELEMIQEVNKEVGGQLEPHVTCMVGYPWESYEEARNTVEYTKSLFREELIDSLQATICIPYPGTKLFKQCEKNNWLKTRDWARYDMSEPVMKIDYSEEKLLSLVRNIYTSCLTPKFIWKKLLSVRNLDDVKWFMGAAKKVIAHYLDFL